MEQLTLFGSSVQPPHKYIIDTCSIFSQKDTNPNRRDVFKSLWSYIDSLVREKIIVTCSEIVEELRDDKLMMGWIKEVECVILPVDERVQNNVTKIVTTHPKLVDFKQIKSSSDAFLIATAMAHGLIIVTEEDKKSYKKIPQVAASFGVESLNIIELCAKEGKEF